MDKDLSDSELVRKTLNGALEAFTDLVRRYQDVAYAAAYSLVHNFHDARDIAQEAWIRAYQRLVTYDPNRPFGAWLYRISKRCAVDWLRSRQHLPVADLAAAANIPDPRPQPDEEQEDRERYEMIHRALSSLSEVNRETTVLYYIDGYSQRDISGFLSVPLGTVKRRLHDSRKLLQKEVMKMVKEIFEENKLEWKFTEDVVNSVSELKKSLADHLPDKFRELGRMSKDELSERQKHVLQSLVKVLSISPEEVGIERKVKIQTADMSDEEKEYLWQTLHELELIQMLIGIVDGSTFLNEIQNFSDVTVEVGRYDASGDRLHNKLYVAFQILPNNDRNGYRSWNQALIED